jgi:hypothetical protein
MSEGEFERMLDAVRTAIAPAPAGDFLAHPPVAGELPKVANDNLPAWPFIPFPEGWHAVLTDPQELEPANSVPGCCAPAI